MSTYVDADGDRLEVETFQEYVELEAQDSDDGERAIVHLDRSHATALRDELNAWPIATDPHPHGPSPEDLDAAGVPDSVAIEAHSLVYGERGESYGHPRIHWTRTAIIWTGLLSTKLADGEHITPEDVGRLYIGDKLSRDVHETKRDNRVDMAGYAVCLDRLETGK